FERTKTADRDRFPAILRRGTRVAIAPLPDRFPGPSWRKSYAGGRSAAHRQRQAENFGKPPRSGATPAIRNYHAVTNPWLVDSGVDTLDSRIQPEPDGLRQTESTAPTPPIATTTIDRIVHDPRLRSRADRDLAACAPAALREERQAARCRPGRED